jgi:dsDNA-specific endonuclease/ATPase MutS2
MVNVSFTVKIKAFEDMNRIDLHGYLVEDAIEEVENLIGKIRLSGREGYLKVITGHGKIQKELMFYLLDHGIEHSFEPGNKGAMIICVD